MTILSAAQAAARRLNQSLPSSLFTTTDPFALELADIASESAIAIAKAHDWQKLTTLYTLTGDGATTSYSLPSDYDRMPIKAHVQTSQFATSFVKARDTDFWLHLQLHPQIGVPGYWIILGGLMQFSPALADGVSAKFYYIKNAIVTGGTKTSFTADTDTFDLSERLLTLDMVWRWRAMKRLEYAEDMQNFELALSQEIAADKGPRVIVVGTPRFPIDADYPHPAISV